MINGVKTIVKKKLFQFMKNVVIVLLDVKWQLSKKLTRRGAGREVEDLRKTYIKAEVLVNDETIRKHVKMSRSTPEKRRLYCD